MSVHLILGGARSGKSSHAEQWVRQVSTNFQRGEVSRPLHYVATAIAFDDEMKTRIEHHRHSRGVGGGEHEAPLALAELLKRFQADDVVLVDCLTLWLNNVIFNHGDTARADDIHDAVNTLVDVLSASSAYLCLVSNEVGLGVVPMGQVSRLFVDHAGWMNQRIAAIADRVDFVAAGLPMRLKG